MKNVKGLGKSCAPFGRKKKEEEDAPIATRVRSKDNQVQHVASLSRNQTVDHVFRVKDERKKKKEKLRCLWLAAELFLCLKDKNSQNSRHKSNSCEVHSSSSSSRTTQHVQLSEDPKNKSHETKGNRRFTQPNKNEANNTTNASSSSQIDHQLNQKMKNLRFSEKSSQHNRPLEEEDPYDLPVVEPYTPYIRSQERQREAVGYMCMLCERDLGETEFGGVEEEDCDLYPETSIFPCGHVYHTSCLRFQFGNQDVTEDSCIFCFI